MAALSVPLVFEPLIGAGAASLLQFMVVFGTSRYFDNKSGELGPGSSRGAIVRSLKLEAVLILGSLIGLVVGIGAVGTSGNTVGDVLGGLIAGALFLQHEAKNKPAPGPEPEANSVAEPPPASPPQVQPDAGQ